MSATHTIVVTKRDGTIERYRPSKLVNSLARVMQARSYDPKLAEALVRAVTMHLCEWADQRPPTTHYIHRCVCSVLRQTGLEEVAEDLTNRRRLRTIHRRQIRVIADANDGHGAAWRKDEVVATLQNRYGLRYAVCRFLAGQIEQHVFALNYRLVRKSFLAELVRSEVLAWGLVDGPVASGSPVAVPPAASRPPEDDD